MICCKCGTNQATDSTWYDLPFYDGKDKQICSPCEKYLRYCHSCLKFYLVEDPNSKPRACPKCMH